MALVTATTGEMDALLDDIQVDEGFSMLLGLCAAHCVPVHVVSDGFDYCIQRILERPSLNLGPYLRTMRILSSHLEPEGTRWHARFPSFEPACPHGCATCKPAAMASLNRRGAPTVFAGDGLSDRYAAASADHVFAKGRLARHCAERAISYGVFDSLATVAAQLEGLLGSSATPRRAFSRRVFRAI
jgi:2-hydroxy-3-keto-5-methylthiopentenyl-1-phosphate phosphatase